MSSDFNDIPFFPRNYFFKTSAVKSGIFIAEKATRRQNIRGYKSIIRHYAFFAGKPKTTAPFFTELCDNRLIRRLFNFFSPYFLCSF